MHHARLSAVSTTHASLFYISVWQTVHIAIAIIWLIRIRRERAGDKGITLILRRAAKAGIQARIGSGVVILIVIVVVVVFFIFVLIQQT